MFKFNQFNNAVKSWAIKFIDICLVSVLLLLIAVTSLHAEEVTLKYKGLTLNANLTMAEGKSFKDGIVLVLHGLMAHNKMEIISTVQQALLDNEMNSLAINLSLGVDNRHGFFDCTAPHRHKQESAVKEIGAWVGWLRDKGVTKVILLAHSRGANQAMVYAVEEKDPEVSHLVMLAPGAGEKVKLLYKERYGKSLDQTLAVAQLQIAEGRGGELMQDIDIVICPKASVTADTFMSYYSEGNKFRKFKTYLPRISIPALVVTGTMDERQPETVALLSSIIDGEHTQLSVIEGAGHFFRDFNIEEAIEATVEFINE